MTQLYRQYPREFSGSRKGIQAAVFLKESANFNAALSLVFSKTPYTKYS